METLIKKFKQCDKVTTKLYGIHFDVKKYFDEDNSILKSFKHYDNIVTKYYCKTKKDIIKFLTNKDKWITYGDCVKTTCYYKNNKKVVVVVQIYGKKYSMHYGDEVTPEWEAEFLLPIDFICNERIKNNIEREFKEFLIECYEQHLKNEMNIWLQNFEKEFLANTCV